MQVVRNVRPRPLALDIADIARDHYESVFRFCARRVGGDRAPDVAQETFLTAQKVLHKFRGESSLTTWLFGIANNECRRECRRLKIEPALLDIDPQCPAHGESEEALVGREVLRQAIAKLTPDHREVIVLHELDGLTYEEVAVILDVPVGTVKSRLHHAFLNLRKLMFPRDGGGTMSVRDDLKAYVDGELPLGRMDEVRAAIERDPGLAREVAELRLLSTALRSVDASSPVVGLDDALAALRRRNWKHTPWITWPLGVAAACLAAGLIVVAQHAGQKTMDSSGTVAMEDRESARAPGASMDLQKAAKEPAPSVASPQRASKSAPALKSSPPEPSLSAPALPAAAPSVRVARDRAATRSAALLKARMITPGQKDASANTLANSRKGPSFPLGGATVPGLQDGSATVNASRPARTKPSLLNANTVAAAGELNLRSGSPAMSFGVPAPAPIVVEVPSIGDAESRLRAASFAYTKLRGSNSPDGPPVEIVIDVPEARVLAALVAARGADAQSNSHAYRAIESGQGGGGNRVEGGGFGGRAGAGGFGGGVGAPGPSRGFAQSAAPTPTPPGGRSPQDLTPGLPKAVAQRPVDGDAGKQLATVPPKQPQSDAAGVWYNATPQQLPAKNAQTAGRSKSTVLGTKQVPVPQAPRDAITNNRGTATQTGALSANQGQSVLLTSPTANSKNAPMRRIIVILRQKPPAGKLEP